VCLGWKQAPPGGAAMKELAEFLPDRAMEHDSPTLLFNLAAGYLISAKVIRPDVGQAAAKSAAVGAISWNQSSSDQAQ
jgi:hypothetical protein